MKTKSPFMESIQNTTLCSCLREIVNIADPEKILLLSASYDYHLTENIFINHPVQEFNGGCYNVLILSDCHGKESPAKLKTMIWNLLNGRRNLQFHIMDINSFNEYQDMIIREIIGETGQTVNHHKFLFMQRIKRT
jgi:hypothetical protein